MSIRTRKLIGAVALFVLVVIWALLAMAIAQFPPIFNSGWLATLYYMIAGLGWVLPAMPLIRWMSRPDAVAAQQHRSPTPR
jgi:drug/metabolite transporter (DMT)-like permease